MAGPWAEVAPEATLARVGELLAEHGLRQVPVVDGGRVVGYVGEAEIARLFLQTVAGPPAIPS